MPEPNRGGRPRSPRTLRDDARLELEIDQLAHLHNAAAAIRVVERELAHVNRRRINALRLSLAAQEAEDRQATVIPFPARPEPDPTGPVAVAA